MKLTYDAVKRELTLERRGLDFADAELVFSGRQVSRVDERFDYGERRIVTVGRLKDEVVVIVWTAREGSRRIISMRRAMRDERQDYIRRLGRFG